MSYTVSQGGWNSGQIVATLYADSAASGTYDVQVISGGSNGFQGPQGNARSNLAQVQVQAPQVSPAPQFSVLYGAYIPVDNVTGPSYCFYLPIATNWPLLYMGDNGRGTYRASESITIIPDQQSASGFVAATGQTRNYGFGSPANGSTLSSADEDGVRFDCYLWHDLGQADTSQISHDETYPYLHQGQEHLAGSAANPLEAISPPISWDMRVLVDTTNPQAPTALVNYNHDCYPAHQVTVNGKSVYSYSPPRNDTAYIANCLAGMGKVIGQQSTPTVVPAH